MLEWLALPHLVLASATDLRSRSVPNEIWLHLSILGPVVATMNGSWASLVLSLPIGFGLWASGLGGADAKAIMVLGFYFEPFSWCVGLFLSLAGVAGVRLRRNTSLPFIPFVLLGFTVAALLV